MNSNDKDRLFASDSDGPDDEHPPERAPRGAQRERGYNHFDEQDEDYEEPDRDTDCATIFTEEDDEGYYLDEPEPLAEDIFSERKTGGKNREPEDDDDWAEDDDETWDPEARWDDEPDSAGERNDRDWDDEDEDEDDSRQDTPAQAAALKPRREMLDSDLDWEDEDPYPDAATEETGMWPLSLIAVAVVALLLLAAGGYGVLQQRAAMQEEIRQLQADLATAVTPAEAAASREAARDLEQQNGELQARLDALILENSRLEETVSRLESQLAATPVAVAEPAAPEETRPEPKPLTAAVKPAPAPAAPPEKRPATATSSAASAGWFVNFGSYSQRAMAESWAARLKPAAGEVVVTTGNKGGERFYRVRVVDLASREQAERTARQLESDHGLSRLWVGSN